MSTSIAVDSSYTVPIQINGKEIVNENTFEVVSPGTKKTVWKAVSATKEDALAAVEAAEAAFPAWRKAKPAAKRSIFLKAADILESRAEELCQYLLDETGGTQQFATYNIVSSAELIRDVAGRIITIAGTVPVCQVDGTNAIVFKEPYGVILAIAPWLESQIPIIMTKTNSIIRNAPYILGFRSIIYALAAGNTAVLKGPELSPRIFWAIGSVFAEAGLPAGVLNVIQHRPQDAAVVTETLIADRRVMHVNFTGSTFVGSIIAATAGKYLKPVLMELGGKASALILDDADLKIAAFQCAIGAFLNVC
jgi:acyl-CoA reductase-like NAD-dependent aldehyde dehydrogenase